MHAGLPASSCVGATAAEPSPNRLPWSSRPLSVSGFVPLGDITEYRSFLVFLFHFLLAIVTAFSERLKPWEEGLQTLCIASLTFLSLSVLLSLSFWACLFLPQACDSVSGGVLGGGGGFGVCVWAPAEGGWGGPAQGSRNNAAEAPFCWVWRRERGSLEIYWGCLKVSLLLSRSLSRRMACAISKRSFAKNRNGRLAGLDDWAKRVVMSSPALSLFQILSFFDLAWPGCAISFPGTCSCLSDLCVAYWFYW